MLTGRPANVEMAFSLRKVDLMDGAKEPSQAMMIAWLCFCYIPVSCMRQCAAQRHYILSTRGISVKYSCTKERYYPPRNFVHQHVHFHRDPAFADGVSHKIFV